jgi:outer membrane protein OmpA-like peptidoglycan-associated protein
LPISQLTLTKISVPTPSTTRLSSDALRRVTQLKSDLHAEEVTEGVRISLLGDVLFDFDQSVIRSDAKPVLQKVAELIQQSGVPHVTIYGHTDAKGAPTHNKELSARRADTVKSHLVTYFAIAAEQLRTEGLGATKPIAPNANPDGSDNPEGRQRNRRVEIVISRQ